MSECHLSSEIYIKNIENRERLIQLLSDEDKEVQLDTEILRVESFLIDEVISINGMTAGYIPLDLEFKKWIKQFKPDITLVYVEGDEYSDSFGLQGNKKISYKKTLGLLKKISKRIETGITMEDSEKSILAYLEANSISPLETFQGVKHIDRVIVNREWKAIEYFVDRGLDPNHIVRDHQTASISYDYLIHRFISYDEGIPLLRKCINNGCDVNVLDHNHHNLLHMIDICDITMLEEFVRARVNVNQLDKECRTPLLHITRRFFQSDNPNYHIEKLISGFEILTEAGADPYLFDKYGAGILLYCRKCPDIQEKLLSKWPDLKIHDPDKTYDTAVSSLFRASRLRKKFYKICIDEEIYQPFYDDSFIEFLNNSSHTRSPEIELDILENAMYIMDLACSIDNLDILKRVESLNFPLNMPVKIGTTLFEASQKSSNKNIYSYLQSKNCTDDINVNFRSLLENWIKEARAEAKFGSDISQYYSKGWEKQIEIERDRAIGWGSTSEESNLASQIKKEFVDFLVSNKSPNLSGIWGTEIYIDYTKKQGAIIDGEKFILITPSEVFEKLGLTIREA